jgi:hypothetical protein
MCLSNIENGSATFLQDVFSSPLRFDFHHGWMLTNTDYPPLTLYIARNLRVHSGPSVSIRNFRFFAQSQRINTFMKMIQPNCRIQFTAKDIDFITRVLGRKRDHAGCLVALLTEPDTRDLILDDEALFRALLEETGCLGVSNHFYFYVLVRQVLRRAGIEDRAVADYVAEVLTEYSRMEQSRCIVPGQTHPLEYFFEMLGALRTADERTTFMLRTHIGNHSLFLSGLFPERIRFRAESKGFPDLKYYQEVGRTNYRVASDHRLAQRYELAPIFQTLAENFEPARRALNDLSERIFSLGDNDRFARAILGQNERKN